LSLPKQPRNIFVACKSMLNGPPCAHLCPHTVRDPLLGLLRPRTPSLLSTIDCSCTRITGRGPRDGGWQFLRTKVSLRTSKDTRQHLTNVEEKNRHQHSEVDAGEQDEDPEPDGGDKVRCDLVHNTPCYRECNGSESDTFGTTGKWEDLCRVDPAVISISLGLDTLLHQTYQTVNQVAPYVKVYVYSTAATPAPY